ncbi:MAG: nitroreductase family protein [Anaerolineales bacterium]
MTFSQPVTELIKKRYSCRNYLKTPIDKSLLNRLTDKLSSYEPGPFGNRPRYKIIAATERDRKEIKKLGTYGFIKDAAGFIVGVIEDPENELEDFGYLMERIILHATDIGLATCWLGGTFTKNSFSKKIPLKTNELIPAVTAIGYPAGNPRMPEKVSRRPEPGDRRLPWRKLFFDGTFDTPLSSEDSGIFALPLDMVRLGPSASNRQPWRIIKDGETYHFYLQRTPGYQERFLVKLVTVADLQRIDMGIAMYHFEVTARGMGMTGEWKMREPGIGKPDSFTEYVASWVNTGKPK